MQHHASQYTNAPYDMSIIIPALYLKRPVNMKRFFMPRYFLDDTLQDIAKNVKLKYEVIVVCNSRDDDLVDYVQASPIIHKYALNSVNVGVARSWNMGAHMAEGRSLMFLNDDVAVGAGTFERLFELLIADPTIGNIGPAGTFWRGAEHQSYYEGHDVTAVDVLSGFCFLTPRQTYHQLGGFDNAYSPAGFEEIDYCYAIKEAGLTNVVVPDLAIHHYHHHGVSAQKTIVKYLSQEISTDELHLRNKTYFMRKWNLNEQTP